MAVEKAMGAGGPGAALLPEDVVNPEDLVVDFADEEAAQLAEEYGYAVDSGEEAAMEPEEFAMNLADALPVEVQQSLCNDVMEWVQADIAARSDWEDALVQAMKLLGVTIEDVTEPWDGACGVFHPMMMEAVIKFQSEIIQETFPARGPCKAQLVQGEQDFQLNKIADAVVQDINNTLTIGMPEFVSQHEQMLFQLAFAGSAFKKIYFDPTLGRPRSMAVPPWDFIKPDYVGDLSTCPRYAHRIRYDEVSMRRMQKSMYRDVDLPEPGTGPTDTESVVQDAQDKVFGFNNTNTEFGEYVVYEMHAEFQMPWDAEMKPYVVSVEATTNTLMAVYRNWVETDTLKRKRLHFAGYDMIIATGGYGLGYAHLLGNTTSAATSLLRQLVDAGVLSNLPGGFKDRQAKIKGDSTPIGPGEWRDVDLTGGALDQAFRPLPYKEPSATLNNLMGTIVAEGRQLAAVSDLKPADMNSQAPVGTTLALLERSLKTLSAAAARVHRSFANELRMVKRILADYYSDISMDNRLTADPQAYLDINIVPVSNPNSATQTQRIMQFQTVLQMAEKYPQLFDVDYLARAFLVALGLPDVDQMMPPKNQLQPTDPVAENMAIINLQPVKAFQHQDHKAHIAVHMAAMQDPQLMQMIGQSPQAQAIMSAAEAHVREHVAFQYQADMQQMMGAPLPQGQMSPEQENQSAAVIAEASNRLLQKHQQEAAAQEAAQKAQDPVIQNQQADLAIRQEKNAIDRDKANRDFIVSLMELGLKAEQAEDDSAKALVAQIMDLAKTAGMSLDQGQKANLQ